MNVSRAVEYRFHSASSVLRSSPLIVRHSSRISRSRSPAAFHCVEFVGQILGLGGQRLLAGGLRGAVLVALGPLRLRGFVGVLDDGGQPRGERVDVTEHVRLRQGFGECGGGRLDLARVAGP